MGNPEKTAGIRKEREPHSLKYKQNLDNPAYGIVNYGELVVCIQGIIKEATYGMGNIRILWDKEEQPTGLILPTTLLIANRNPDQITRARDGSNYIGLKPINKGEWVELSLDQLKTALRKSVAKARKIEFISR